MSDNRSLLIRKKIICLDQFAASKMDNKEGEWGYARELLYHAVKDNLVICPIPMEHYVETSKRSLEKAISTDSLLRSLSIGYSFKPWEYIVMGEILSVLESQKPISWEVLYFNPISESMNFRNRIFWEQCSNATKLYHEYSSREKDKLNSLQKLMRTRPAKKQSALMLISAIMTCSALQYAETFRKVAEIECLPDFNITGYMPTHERIALMMRKQNFSKDTLLSVAEEFDKNHFNNIPSLYTFYSMKGYKTVMYENTSVNDGVDLERISSGINISDFLFTDKRQKEKLQMLGLDQRYGTKVYSPLDCKAFIEDLKHSFMKSDDL